MKFDDQSLLANHQFDAVASNRAAANDFNYLRKSKSYYDYNKRQNLNNLKSHYKNLGTIMDLRSNSQQIKSLRPDLNLKESYNLPDNQHYKSADGTQYKYSNVDGFQTTIIDYPSKNVIHVPGKYHELYRSSVDSSEVPQNIRHKFGTNTTEKLLSDPLKVHDTLSHIQNLGTIKKHDKFAPDEGPSELFKQLNTAAASKVIPGTDYYDLGHSICHGYPVVASADSTTTRSSYNEAVSKEHLTDWESNVKSPYRRHKDWLGKWTEQSLVSNKLTKELIKTYADRAKAKADAKGGAP